MKHERIHELLALRLYGELDDDEARELDGHLVGCDACRAYAAELESTLGQLARQTAAAEPPLPDDWTLRMDRIASASPERARGARLLTFAAGVAAGLLAAALLRGGTPRPSAPRDTTAGRMGYVESSSTPPPAPVRSRLGALDR